MPPRKTRTDRARDIALFRYALIRPLADPGLSKAERGALVRQTAERVHIGPDGSPIKVSRTSLDRWIRAWRTEGFDALIPTTRRIEPRTEQALLELAVTLKTERPARTATHIARILAARHGDGPSARTIQRHFARLGLNRRPDGSAPRSFGRFEAAAPDELWLTDGLHGPLIDGRRAVLFAILDDHSRYLVGHRWGYGEDTLSMQATLHDAVKTHGCPRSLYSDNGSAYSSGQLGWSVATLGIALVHSKPGRPQGRGKIERWNRTCREQFLVEIETDPATGTGTPVTSLNDLNRLFSAWLHQHYHHSMHAETGATPAQRYHHHDRPPVMRPSPALLRRAFSWRQQRTVTSFATVSLHGNRYQVEAALAGRKVDLLFNPHDLSRIEVEYQGRAMGVAVPHTITRHVHRDIKTPAATPAAVTGIDYLALLETTHQAQVGTAINFAALAGAAPAATPHNDNDNDNDNDNRHTGADPA